MNPRRPFLEMFLQLIQDTRNFLGIPSLISDQENALKQPLESKKEAIPQDLDHNQQNEEFTQQKSTTGPKEKTQKRETTISLFSLEAPPPMPLYQQENEIESLVKKHVPEILHRPAACVFLFFDPIHEHFLTSVANATSKVAMPACALLFKSEEIFTDTRIQIIAAQEDRLPILAQKPLHRVIERQKGPHFFTLAPIEKYLQDQALKKDLWKALKKLSISNAPQ